MNDTELMTRLSALDPEHGREPTAQEMQREHALFAHITTETGSARARRTTIRRRVLITGAAVVIGALVLVAVVVTRPHAQVTTEALGTGTLSAADVSTWTSAPSPTPPGAALVSRCAAHLGGEPLALGTPSTVLSDLRGEVSSVIVAVGSYTGYCVRGSDPDPLFVLLTDPGFGRPATKPNAITLGASGAHSVPHGFQFAEGTAGGSVTSVTIHQDGLDIVASVGGGYWMAWWPLEDTDTSDPIVTGPFTVNTADGQTSTYSAAQIQVQ
jgi:hypothetical protein